MRCRRGALVATYILILVGSPVRGAIILGSGDDPLTGRNLGAAPLGLSSYVGTFGVGLGNQYIGTPISPCAFVTASHVNYAVNGQFTFNSTNYNVSLEATQDDLAIWHINDGALFPVFAPLYVNANEVGQRMVVIGRGTQRGAEDRNAANELRGWEWGALDGLTSWGTNTVRQVVDGNTFPFGGFGGDHLYFTFDQVGTGDNLLNDLNEAIVSGGDSGGAIFVQDPSDGIYKLAGINSLVDGVNQTSGGPLITRALFDARGYFDGTTEMTPDPVPLGGYSTRLSTRLDFINANLACPIPEPSCIVLTGLAALAGALYRWRRRTGARGQDP